MARRRHVAKSTDTVAAVPQDADRDAATTVALERSQNVFDLDILPGVCNPPILREDDEIWRIDSSDAECTWDDQPTTNGLIYYHLEGRSDWRQATSENFEKAGRGPKATVFVLHGNRTSLFEATGMVWDVYRLVSQADAQPLRMVLWTWPSRRTFNRPRRDVRIKAERSELTGRQLAGVLRRIDPHAPVGLVGFSFGVRAITKARHLLGQEATQGASSIANVSLQPGRSAPMRALLIAAAIDHDALLPSGPYRLAASQVDRMIVTHNGCDRLLRTYRHLYCWHGPDALGVIGFASDQARADGPLKNIEFLDVSGSVGKIHRWPNYIQAREITAALRSDLLGHGGL